MLAILYFVMTLAMASSQDPVKSRCHTCMRFDTYCYNASLLLNLDAEFRNNIVIPEMDILRRENILYFVHEPKIENPEFSKVSFVDLNNNMSKCITLRSPEDRIFNFGTVYVDQDNNLVYLGGNGIAKIESSRKTLNQTLQNETIIDIFVKNNNVYFVRDGEFKIVQKVDTDKYEYRSYSEKIMKFVIDNENYVVAITKSGLYLYKGGDKVLLSYNPFFRGITIDLDGIIYAWWIDEIYKVVIDVEFPKSRLVRVAKFYGMGAMTFDNSNNVLVTKDRHVIRLARTDIKDCQ